MRRDDDVRERGRSLAVRAGGEGGSRAFIWERRGPTPGVCVCVCVYPFSRETCWLIGKRENKAHLARLRPGI
jgi:hypothetical protein